MDSKEQNKMIRSAYAKLTPAQQRVVDRKARAASDAAKAYAVARDAFHKLNEVQWAAFREYAKALGLPAKTFE